MNLENYLDVESLKNSRREIKKIFFYRVCGTGMGSAACLLKEAGFQVEGADSQFYPPMSTYLKSTNITLHDLNSFDLNQLQDFDLIVVGNVVPKMSEEARKIEELGVPFCSFPAAIGALVLCDQNVVGVAGTHGKTTTTYLLTQMFEKLGKDPGYLIGGVLDERPSSKIGDGSYFFIESDEYDCAYFEKISKFRHYYINHLILTSLEFDHADIFETMEDIVHEFSYLMLSVDKSFIGCCDYPEIIKLQEKTKLDIQYYGESAEKVPEIVSMTEFGTEFKIIYRNELLTFKTNLIGKHNILNLTACLIFGLNEGFSHKELQNSISELELVKRRQEERGFYKETLIIDDFAHHPRAVYYTLDGLKIKYPKKKLFVFLEPSSATARSSLHQEEFAKSLSIADKAIIMKPTKATTAKKFTDLDCEKLSKDLENSVVVKNLEELRAQIDENTHKDHIYIFLSNGTCLGLWGSDFASQIDS